MTIWNALALVDNLGKNSRWYSQIDGDFFDENMSRSVITWLIREYDICESESESIPTGTPNDEVGQVKR